MARIGFLAPSRLDLFYANKIDSNTFADVSAVWRRGGPLQRETDELEQNSQAADIAVDKFDHVAKLLSRLDLESI